MHTFVKGSADSFWTNGGRFGCTHRSEYKSCKMGRLRKCFTCIKYTVGKEKEEKKWWRGIYRVAARRDGKSDRVVAEA